MKLLSKMPPEQAAAIIAELIETAPPFAYEAGSLSVEEMKWLGRAEAILGEVGPVGASLKFGVARDCLFGYSHDRNQLLLPLYHAYSAAELKLPVGSQGAYIPPGDTWNGYAAVVKLLSERQEPALIVDPYLDGTFITDFAPLATQMKAIHGLTSDRYAASLGRVDKRLQP